MGVGVAAIEGAVAEAEAVGEPEGEGGVEEGEKDPRNKKKLRFEKEKLINYKSLLNK